MKLITKLTFAAAILALCSCSGPKPQFSTFSDHFISVMKEDGCSLLEAAQWIRSIGIEGIDARIELSDEQMADFIAAGIRPACAILDIAHTNKTPEEMLAMEDQAIEFCKKYGFERMLYVPVLPAPGAEESVLDSLRQNAARFTRKAVAEGIDVVFEDYDNTLSIVYNMAALDKVFALSPDAKCAFDSGNFVYAGDDPMEAFNKYKSRIAHVHLKDRYAVADRESAVIGTGIAHCKEILDLLLADGYKGWFTIEGYGVKDMKSHLEESVRNMSAK